MKILMVIAQKDFRDEEFFEPKGIFEKNNIEVKVASHELATARGKLGGEVMPDLRLEDVDASEFDGVVFVGGGGSKVYADDPAAHKLISVFFDAGKTVGAICLAPLILSRAGILQRRKVTAWQGVEEELKERGAIYTGTPVEIDGNIVTGSGPDASREFGTKIVESLKSKG